MFIFLIKKRLKEFGQVLDEDDDEDDDDDDDDDDVEDEDEDDEEEEEKQEKEHGDDKEAGEVHDGKTQNRTEDVDKGDDEVAIVKMNVPSRDDTNGEKLENGVMINHNDKESLEDEEPLRTDDLARCTGEERNGDKLGEEDTLRDEEYAEGNAEV